MIYKLRILRFSVLLLTGLIVLININGVFAQNVAITDDEGYSAHSSAMLDVKSVNKGMLVPRLTTVQMNNISDAATGLMIFNTDNNKFYFYNGSDWVDQSAEGIWILDGSDVYLSDPDYNVGIGSDEPVGKLEVKGDAVSGIDEPLFAVINNDGDTVFAVYPEGVRIYVDDNGSKASGSKGGFAVGGFSTGKGVTNEFLRVTPDSVRVYIDDEFAKASKGGFAVGGFSTGKGITDDYLFVEREQSRVYVDGSEGFAVSNIAGGNSVEYMDLTPENYFIGHESGLSNTSGQYNSFVGYQTGRSNTSGKNNVLLGYKSGINNTTGNKNIFLGTYAGYTNTTGYENVFLGDSSGYSNNGALNIFMGSSSGVSNTSGNYNVAIGAKCGHENTTGYMNTFLGCWSGYRNKTGYDNVFVGNLSGYTNDPGHQNVFLGSNSGLYNFDGNDNTFVGSYAGHKNDYGDNNVALGFAAGYSNQSGNKNVFLGYYAGSGETGSDRLFIENSSADSAGALIWGDFNNNLLRFNADVGIGIHPLYKLHVIDNSASNDNPAVYGQHAVTDFYGIGVKGVAKYIGVIGEVNSASGNIIGVRGVASGAGTGSRYGIYGSASGGATAYGGYFSGNVHVNGTLSKNAGSFKIDHPLDPENKYLVHSFVESPDMKNIYDGVIVLDEQGRGIVELPAYFEVLNRDFRYQLTAIGSSAPGIYIEQEITDNRFVIAGGSPGMKISWQVTGIRKDPYAEKYRIKVEEEKQEQDKGYYLNPELYDMPEDKNIDNINRNKK